LTIYSYLAIYSHNVTEIGAVPNDSLAEFELVMLAALRLGPEEAYMVSIAADIAQNAGRAV
jgi:hypothetical protein